MRKKLTALFLTFCLALTPFASAFAAGGETDQETVVEVVSSDDLTKALQKGGSIKLTDSFTVSNRQNWTITKDVVLDLNGYTIESTFGSSNYYLMTIQGASLTIKDSSKDQSGKIEATAPSGYGIQLRGNNSSFTLLGGTIETHEETLDIYTITTGCSIQIERGSLISTADSVLNVRGEDTKVNITDGDLFSDGRCGIYVSNYGDTDSIKFNMSGGTLTHTGGNSGAIQMYKGATVTIGGDALITSSNQVVQVQENCALNVTGGTLSSTNNGNGYLAISADDKSVVTISDGNILTDSSSSPAVKAEANSSIKITGGTFDTKDDTSITKTDEATIVLAGGNFPEGTIPNEFLSSGATVVNNEDGTISIEPSNTAAYIVDDVPFSDLAEAIAALEDGSVMEIMPGEHDVTVTRTGDKQTYGSIFVIQKDNVTVRPADAEKGATLYGFTNEYNDGFDTHGISGQATVYVAGENVTLEGLTILPLGGYTGGDDKDFPTKTVGVKEGADGFTMTGCTTAPNEKEKDNQGEHTMMLPTAPNWKRTALEKAQPLLQAGPIPQARRSMKSMLPRTTGATA